MQVEKTETSLEIESEEKNVRDRYKIVFILFAVIGVIHNLPASFFTTAYDYWMYKFRNTTSEKVDSDHRTYYQIEFSPSVTISAHVASVVCSYYVIFFGHKLPVRLRIYGSLVLVVLMYVISAIFINIDTDTWQTVFFVVSMIVVAGVNGLGAIFGLSAYSIMAKFPEKTLGSYLNGQGIAGIISSTLQVLALAVGISTTKSAMVYFWIAVGAVSSALVYIALVFKHNYYFHHYDSKQELKEKKGMNLKTFFSVMALIWKSVAIIFLYFLGYNAIQPSITSLVVSEGEGNGEWNDVYFVPVTVYVITAISEYIGRLLTIRYTKFLTSIDGIWHVIFNATRAAVFIPLLMLCNAQPRSHLSVIFPHDYQYIIIITVFSITNGYAVCICYLLIQTSVLPEQVEDAYHVFAIWGTVFMGALSVFAFVSVDLL